MTVRVILIVFVAFCVTSLDQNSSSIVTYPVITVHKVSADYKSQTNQSNISQLLNVKMSTIYFSPFTVATYTMSLQIKAVSEVITSQEINFMASSLTTLMTSSSNMSITSSPAFIGWKVLNAISGCAGFLLNGLGLIIFFRYTTAWKKISFYLLINQLAIDLAAPIFIASQNLCVISSDPLTPGVIETNDTLCRVWYSRSFFWGMLASSSYNVVAVTWERYLKVVHAVTYNNRYTRKVAMLIIVGVWLSGLAYDLPTLIVSSGVSAQNHCAKGAF